MKIKGRQLTKFLFILIVYRAVATDRQLLFTVSYWDKYIFSILGCVLLGICLLIRNKSAIPVHKNVLKISRLLFVPIIFIWAYSMIVTVINQVNFDGYYTRALSNVAFPLLSIIEAVLAFMYFQDEAVDTLFIPYALTYITSIIVAFLESGFKQFYSMIFDSTFNGSVLEMSELLPAIALFLIYYLFQMKYRGMPLKQGLPKVILCTTFLIVGWKRILVLSIIIVILLYIFLLGNTKRVLKRSLVISIIFITLQYIYVYLIRSGTLYQIISSLNIETMARATMWSHLPGVYQFSPLFLGRGVGYVSKWMDNNWHTLGIIGLTQTTGIHNDVLKYYIELGFWVFGIYLFWILYYNTFKIKKELDNKSALIYYIMMVFQILCWFTDNVSGYHTFLFPLYLIIFSMIRDTAKEKEKNNELKI